MQNSSFYTSTDNFLWFGRPNRSLTPNGRRLWLTLIGTNALIIALVALMIGAWPVVPFAGLEVSLVALAFYVMGLHDQDYEQLKFKDGEFSWARQDGKVFTELSGNKMWVQFLVKRVGREQQLFLRYAGQEINVGRDLPEQDRQQLAKTIGAKFIN